MAEVCDPDYAPFSEDAEGEIDVDADGDAEIDPLVEEVVPESASAEIAQITPADMQVDPPQGEEQNVDIDG